MTCSIAALEPAPAREQQPRRAYVAGVYWWNYPIIRALFDSPAGPPVFCSDFDSAHTAAQRNDGDIVAWASRLEKGHLQACAKTGIGVTRVEDGFIRSIGLGAGFVSAASLAVDRRGIYYDDTQPSDLEYRLENQVLSQSQRESGAHLKSRIIDARLSKYNLPHRSPALQLPKGRRIVLVVGQVSDDASIKLSRSGTIDFASSENINLQLLKRVRERHPGAFIIYKPHPDVVAQLRSGRVPDEHASRVADSILPDACVLALIDRCDQVETISSLAGFEALLRGKPVAVHGTPFYAGWGLTTDVVTFPRRTKARTVDELVYIALTQYARHMNPLTGKKCHAHELIDALQRMRESKMHRLRVTALGCMAWACESRRVRG